LVDKKLLKERREREEKPDQRKFRRECVCEITVVIESFPDVVYLCKIADFLVSQGIKVSILTSGLASSFLDYQKRTIKRSI